MTYAMPFQKYVKTVLRVAASPAARAEQLKNAWKSPAKTHMRGEFAGDICIIEISLPGSVISVGPYD